MRCVTRILLVPIFLVPILWVWPQRGTTAAFYTNPQWRNEPAIVRVERQINLDFVTADSSLPQQDFSVEWSGWLRIDRDGQYTFSTRTDDGSTIEIDGHVVVDNGGVHRPTRQTATIAMTPGLHRIRLRFMQAAGTYEFYASWTPPGDKDESALPTQQLFVHKPLAVMVFLTRRVSSLWLLCWFALALVIAARIGKSARDTANADLRRFEPSTGRWRSRSPIQSFRKHVLHVFIDHDNGHRPYRALALTPPQPTRPACPNGAALASRVAIDLVV